MKIHLISANLGGIDNPHFFSKINNTDDIKCYYYTDVDFEADINVKISKLCKNLPNRLQAKYYKFQIHNIKEHQDTEYYVWIDSAFIITDFNKLINFLITRIKDNDILLFKHHCRTNIFEEADFVLDQIKNKGQHYNYLSKRYNYDIIKTQIDSYKEEDPEIKGLYELGLFMRKNTPIVNKIFDDTWLETIKFSTLGQLPLPAMLNRYKNQVKVQEINEINIYSGAGYGFVYQGHRKLK